MKFTPKKTLLCLILAAVVALSLFACGKGDDKPSDSAKDTENASSGVETAVGTDPLGTKPADTDTGPADTGKVEDDSASKEDFYAKEQLVIYPELPEQIHRNYDYKVTVTQGDKSSTIPVYNHTMEYEVSDRSVGGDLYRRFSQFAFSGKQVRVDIKVNRDFEYYSVFPSAKNFKTEYSDGVISVYLDKPDYFGIRLDDDDNSILSVFADLPEYPRDIPSKDAKNVIWVEGWQDVEEGILTIKEKNTILYIAPGAVLNGRVDVRGENSKVLGRGIILDAFENIYKLDIRDGGTESHGVMLCQLYADGAEFDGPVLLDARCFNLMAGKSNVKVRNYKALSSMMTSDGITAGSANATFEHCWIYCADNALVVSGADTQTYKDIALGTTCAAFFPQNGCINITLEDIYVFRSNDGIINNRYNSGEKDRQVEMVFKNIDCMDCLNVNRFFQGANMGKLEKHILFDGISLPHMTGVTDPHKSKSAEYTDVLLQYTTDGISTENYHMTFNNLYIGGELITDASQVTTQGKFNNTVTFTNSGNYTPVERITNQAHYTGTGKVYIGYYLTGFENDIINENGTFYLPAEEILAQLRSQKQPETVDRGIPYTSAEALLKVGAIENFEIKDGNLYLTPVYAGENLLLPDDGVLPQIAEAACFKVDMVAEDNDGDYVYYLYDLRNYYTGGFSIMFTEEIRKYGAGEYEFKFRARGAASGGIHSTWRYDNFDTYTKKAWDLSLSTTWKEFSITLKVDEQMLEDSEMFAVSIIGQGSPMEYFAVKELELVKK